MFMRVIISRYASEMCLGTCTGINPIRRKFDIESRQVTPFQAHVQIFYRLYHVEDQTWIYDIRKKLYQIPGHRFESFDRKKLVSCSIFGVWILGSTVYCHMQDSASVTL